MRKWMTTVLLGAALAAPVAMRADKDDKHEHEAKREKRYYDRQARDYHQWNDNEDRAYRRWLQEQHRDYRDWNRVNRRDQQEYWRWRHQHPDMDDRR
jgi:hypothetical protein